jgi:hypothetical protein
MQKYVYHEEYKCLLRIFSKNMDDTLLLRES